MNTSMPAPSRAIGLVGFDGDDTLWKSEDYYRKAEQDYLDLLSRYIDVHDTRTARHLLEVQQRNLGVFGYGVKGMALSMIEAAIDITGQRIEAKDIQRILDIGHDTLRHPVELIDGVRESVAAIAEHYPVVLITKGDLFHQERKAPPSRRRAKNCKRLNCMSSALRIRRRKGRSCSPMEPDVRQNCLGFATISGAA